MYPLWSDASGDSLRRVKRETGSTLAVASALTRHNLKLKLS